MSKLGIIVNPYSGRDVRRVAARADSQDHRDKSRQVTRIVLGALAQGASEIMLARDPFRIGESAVENLPERDKVTQLKFPLQHSAADTLTMARLMWSEGCRVFVVLGGDGTSRIAAAALEDATILPLSTGTNNVFPYRIEATVAGIAAGLIASGKLSAEETCLRCKRVQVRTGTAADFALVDAVLLRDDFIGNLMPFDAAKIATAVLAIAEPAAIGMSPIGGYITPAYHEDDFGVLVECGEGDQKLSNLPVSAGLHEDLRIRDHRRLALGEPVEVVGPGILAFDGDRTLKLADGETATLSVERDGPRVIDPYALLNIAAKQGLFLSPR